MGKRLFFTPVYLVCLVALVLLLSACNLSVHAKDAHSTSPLVKASVVALASPAMSATAVSSVSPVVDVSAVATDPPIARVPVTTSKPPLLASPALPTFAPDPGVSILYNGSSQQRGSNESRTFIGHFPATPGFVIHITCRGYGLIKVEVSSGIINELSCPQSDNVNEYYTSSPTPRATIRVTAMGAIAWRVVVEGAE